MNLFSNQEETYTETITFEDYESYAGFKRALDKVYATGCGQSLSGVKSIQTTLVDGDSKYPIRDDKNIDKVIIAPSIEPFTWKVKIDGHSDNIELIRKRLKNRIEISSKENAIAEILITIYFDEHRMMFKYNIHVERAKCLNDLVIEYKKVRAFVMDLFKGNTNIPEYKQTVDCLERGLQYYKRAIELENVLNIEIVPSKMQEEQDGNLLLEKLYLMLVKKKRIKSNDRLNYIDNVDTFKGEIGQEIFTAYIKTMHYELYGHEITIFVLSCIFNAIISKIEINDKNERKVYFNDTDTKPMYRSYAGFLSEEEALEEQKHIKAKTHEYQYAKKFSEYLEELAKERVD